MPSDGHDIIAVREMWPKLMQMQIPVEAHHPRSRHRRGSGIDIAYQYLVTMADNVNEYITSPKTWPPGMARSSTSCPTPLFVGGDKRQRHAVHFSLWQLATALRRESRRVVTRWPVGDRRHPQSRPRLRRISQSRANSQAARAPLLSAVVSVYKHPQPIGGRDPHPDLQSESRRPTHRISARPTVVCNRILAFHAMTMPAITASQNKIDPASARQDMYKLTPRDPKKSSPPAPPGF